MDSTDKLRALTASLAEDVGMGGNLQLVRKVLRGVARQGGTRPSPAGQASPAAGPQRVGIWERASDDRSAPFVRSQALKQQWWMWADVETLPPKGARTRVVFIGESVARGVPYTPMYEPADVLAESLNRIGGGVGFEVLDLARTDLTPEGLIDLVDQALVLEPDLVVVFSGNNWKWTFDATWGSRTTEHLLASYELRRGRVPALRSLLAQLQSEYAQRTVDTVVGRTRKANTPLVFVVPEFNLGAWRYRSHVDVPALPDDRTTRWFEVVRDATAALRGGDPARALSLAKTASEIDAGTAATPHYIAADACSALGDGAAARSFLELAKDARIWDAGFTSPRPYAAVQAALRGAARDRVAVVDLPKILAAEVPNGVPGLPLFIDYCHLTSEGIRIAMAHVAARVSTVLRPDRPAPKPGAIMARPPAAVAEAGALFAAAVHCAHWGQDAAMVKHLCTAALRADRSIADVMRAYLDVQSRRAPQWLCQQGLKILAASRCLEAYFRNLARQKWIDVELLDSIAAALEDSGAAGAIADLRRLRATEYALTPGRDEDLLRFCYTPASTEREWTWTFPMDFGPAPSRYYRARSPHSEFTFVLNEPGAVELDITLRGGQGSADLRVNGKSVQALGLTDRWARHRVRIASDRLAAGVNRASVEWPSLLRGEATTIERAAEDLERGLFPDLFPVFGEIFALVARLPSA